MAPVNVTSVQSGASTMTPLTPQQRRMHDAAEKFEAMMLGEMLKPLQKGLSDDDSKEADTLTTYSTEALAQNMAHHGGLGIAARIEARLSKR